MFPMTTRWPGGQRVYHGLNGTPKCHIDCVTAVHGIGVATDRVRDASKVAEQAESVDSDRGTARTLTLRRSSLLPTQTPTHTTPTVLAPRQPPASSCWPILLRVRQSRSGASRLVAERNTRRAGSRKQPRPARGGSTPPRSTSVYRLSNETKCKL